MTLTPVGHRVVPAGSVADVIDLSDSQLDRKALRRDGRDVLESDGRVREQNLKKSITFVRDILQSAKKPVSINFGEIF